jgi:heavy metal response regulator
LLVEDEKALAEFLAKGLRENGYAVDVSHDGDEGGFLATTEPYDVIILDIMLPGQSGLDLLKELRTAGRSSPVLILSARDALEDRIRGLDLGADDYLVKPFAFPELLARLRALQRRPPSMSPAQLACDDLSMDLVRHRVVRAGREIELTPKEFSLLEYLLRHRGEVVTRTAIIEHVWDMQFDSFSNVLEVLVNRVRNKVDVPFGRLLIHTVRGVGYALRAE